MSTATDNRFYREPHTQVVEKLSLREQFRLVEIAHETKDAEIRGAAMKVLRQYLNPVMFVTGSNEQSAQEK